MKILHLAPIGLLIFFSSQLYAQAGSQAPSASQSAPVDGGAIIMPPAKNPGPARETTESAHPSQDHKPTDKPRQRNVTPEEAAKHGQKQVKPNHPKSLDDNCKGHTELCKQDSAR